MSNIKPIYIFALIGVLLFLAYIKISNPYQKYSTQNYWRGATIETAEQVPEEALRWGNKNGPVLAPAAMAASNIEILRVLVDRGADINERDAYGGTPFSIAAANGQYPEMLRELVRLGADVNVRVKNEATPLMLAVAYNDNMDILRELVDLGVPINSKDLDGRTAYDYAKKLNKVAAENLLKDLIRK